MTHDVTIIHVPPVRQASMFLQSVSQAVISGEMFRSTQLIVGDYLQFGCVFCLQAL